MKNNPLSTAEFRALQREIYAEKVRECATIEDAVLAILDAHVEACEIALSNEPAPVPVKSLALETEYLLGFEGLDSEMYAYLYGGTEAVENALDEERSDIEQSDEIPVRYQDIEQVNGRIEREYVDARLEYRAAVENLDSGEFDFQLLLDIKELKNEMERAKAALDADRARLASAVKKIAALPNPDAVAESEKVRRFNLKPELVRKLQKHNISLDARLRSSADQRDQIPYLVALFDSVWAYDVFMSQSLERYPAKAAFVVESQEDEAIAHALACMHARALESYTDRKFNRFLAKRGRKPLSPRASRKSAPAPAPATPAPAPKPAPAPAAPAPVPLPKSEQLRLF